MGTTKTAAAATALRRSQQRLTLVRVTRRIKGADWLDGYVVGVGRRWVLLACPDDQIRPDGFKAIRLADVKRVSKAPNGRFHRRALELQDAWPPAGPSVPVDLDSTAELVRTLVPLGPLLTVFVEYRWPDVCYIGALGELRRRSLQLWQVTPQARWDGSANYRFKELSRFDVGAGYEAMLARVAGNRDPSQESRPRHPKCTCA